MTEAERGEHAALSAYEDALNGRLPPTASSLIEAQRDAMQQANDRMRALFGLFRWSVQYGVPAWNVNSFPPPLVH